MLILVSLLIGLFVNIVRSDGIPYLAKEMAIAEDVENASGEPKIITLSQAKNLFDKGIIFVDARGDDYYTDAHIKDAWNSGFIMELMFKLDSLQTRDQPVVVYCSDDECGSSEELAFDLYNEGFNNVLVFKGGWIDWKQAGYPVE